MVIGRADPQQFWHAHYYTLLVQKMGVAKINDTGIKLDDKAEIFGKGYSTFISTARWVENLQEAGSP